MTHDIVSLTPQIDELMIASDIVCVDLLQGAQRLQPFSRQRLSASRHQRHVSRAGRTADKTSRMSLRLVYQDPMGNYFHSLITTAPLTLAIGFIVLILFLSVRWLQRQLSGQELLEIRSTRILNGERGANVRGSVYDGQRAPVARLMYCFPKFSLLTNSVVARHPHSLLRRAGHQNRTR